MFPIFTCYTTFSIQETIRKIYKFRAMSICLCKVNGKLIFLNIITVFEKAYIFEYAMLNILLSNFMIRVIKLLKERNFHRIQLSQLTIILRESLIYMCILVTHYVSLVSQAFVQNCNSISAAKYYNHHDHIMPI